MVGVCCVLFGACSVLCGVRRWLFGMGWVLACCALIDARCLLYVVCCVSCVAVCSLFVVCCLLFVGYNV